MRIFGLILAGGAGRRFGGKDKAMLPLAGVPLLTHLSRRLGPQVEDLALSANGDPARFADFDGPILADESAERLGPMAGVLAGLNWLAASGGTHLVTASVDTPFIPGDLLPRLLLAAEGGGGFAIAQSGGRIHPTCALWPLRLHAPLRQALASGERRIGQWASAQGAAIAAFPGSEPDPFFNINTAEDLAQAEAWLARGPT